jgi:hypothetical protein
LDRLFAPRTPTPLDRQRVLDDRTGNGVLRSEGQHGPRGGFVKYLVAYAREHCPDEMELFGKFVDKELLARLDFVVNRPFERITYAEAVELLKKCRNSSSRSIAD